MSGSPPASAALVTALRWKSGAGVVHTTIVAKLTMQLRADARAALVQPEPFVAFDRLAADPRFVAEASELMPWTTVSSVVAYGGPLRFTLAGDGAGAPFRLELPELPHAGVSMSSAERAALAPQRPTRGPDGMLTIADDIDGRYFVAAPKTAQLTSIRGDEAFALELSDWVAERALPGMVVEVSLQVGGQRRVLMLTTDMIVLHVASRRVSLISRALVRGEAALHAHGLQRLGGGSSADRGDAPPPRARRPAVFHAEATTTLSANGLLEMSPGAADETRDASAAELAALRELPAPFVLDPPSEGGPHGGPARLLPATPFDPGFVSQPVQPGVGVDSTLAPDEEMAQQLDRMRRQMRAQPPARPSPAVPALAPEGEGPRVAPPRPGAMAKPRFKRR